MVTTEQMSQTLLAVLILLVTAKFFGYLFGKYKQPEVIGEILGGLMLGPSFLAHFSPNTYQDIFLPDPRVPVALSLIYNFGLIVMMFTSGFEARSLFSSQNRKNTYKMAFTGLVIPFILTSLILVPMALDSFFGENGNKLSFILIMACAASVTSLPVISRIFIDLGIMKSWFAKTVLSVAILDDILLYLVISIALMVSTGSSKVHLGLLEPLLSGQPMLTKIFISTFVGALFVTISLLFGHIFFNFLSHGPFKFLVKKSPVSFLIFVMISVTVLAMKLGVPTILAAFCAGVIATRIKNIEDKSFEDFKVFGFSFFVPIYFAVVGYRIDLASSFNLMLIAGLLVFASLVKGLGIYIGARHSNYSKNISRDLAITMNARGGPGIVLASIAYDAKIVNAQVYTALICLAILTSLISGSWLRRQLERGKIINE